MTYTFAENPEGVNYFIACLVFEIPALIAVALRLWSRQILGASLQLNDYGILFALDQTALSAIWIWSLFAIKVSILDIYIRIFPIKSFIAICRGFIAFQVAWVLAAFLEILLLCRPLAYQWDKSIPGGVCGSFFQSYYSTHIIIFITDFALALLPVPVLWKLKMEPRKKISVALMFALGLTIIIFNLIRLVWREKVASPDITYEYALLFAFSVLEAQIGIVLASVPVMLPALRKLAATWPISLLLAARDDARPAPLRFLTTIGGSGKKKSNMRKLGSFDTEMDSTARLGQDTNIEIDAVGRIPSEEGVRVTHTWEVRH
ncbi:hypothetical protein EKO27_g10070 [Xylaria grammica]|uniref:Rhodopsin domain-containing protein n=1 Tax=Xylaria grammica TaxID=363999 RepID=A0A439CSJ2_9PEZI|nr:hypothetical protein EKO27_g10070 [Xylaria grammica]